MSSFYLLFQVKIYQGNLLQQFGAMYHWIWISGPVHKLKSFEMRKTFETTRNLRQITTGKLIAPKDFNEVC